MVDRRDILMPNGQPAVGTRARRSMPSSLVRARNWPAIATKPCTDATFVDATRVKVHGRRPEEEAS
jgi:hypothetical protein